VALWGLHTKTAALVHKQRAGPTVFHALWRCLRADYADAQHHFDAIWASRVTTHPHSCRTTLSPATDVPPPQQENCWTLKELT
jgi:hypothetical protein